MKSFKMFLESEQKKYSLWFHRDMVGLVSALAAKAYLSDYELVDTHISIYDDLEDETSDGDIMVLADYIDFSTNITILEGKKISKDIDADGYFPEGDIKLIERIKPDDFIKYVISANEIINLLNSDELDIDDERERFMAGYIVNRYVFFLKGKNITVTSLSGTEHVNKNLLECLVFDSEASLKSVFLNLRNYFQNAKKMVWNDVKKIYEEISELLSEYEINQGYNKYIDNRKNDAKYGELFTKFKPRDNSFQPDKKKKLSVVKPEDKKKSKLKRIKKLYQYNKYGGLMRVWNRSKDCADYYHISKGNISAYAKHNTEIDDTHSKDAYRVLHDFIFKFH